MHVELQPTGIVISILEARYYIVGPCTNVWLCKYIYIIIYIKDCRAKRAALRERGGLKKGFNQSNSSIVVTCQNTLAPPQSSYRTVVITLINTVLTLILQHSPQTARVQGSSVLLTFLLAVESVGCFGGHVERHLPELLT